MSRRTVVMLLLLGVTTGSCSFLDGQVQTTAHGLPAVGAPPPGLEPGDRPDATPRADELVAEADALLGLPAATTLTTGGDEPLTAGAIEAYFASRHTGLSAPEIRDLAQVVIDEARRYDLEASLVLAVIQVESACYHRAVSPVGALGLMQLLPSTGEELAARQGIPWMGPETLFDPTINVKLGTAYLKQLQDRYAHVPTALAAYNWGPGRIDRRLRRGDRVPQIYIKQVMRAYDTVDGHLALLASSS